MGHDDAIFSLANIGRATNTPNVISAVVCYSLRARQRVAYRRTLGRPTSFPGCVVGFNGVLKISRDDVNV
jgi:hypothetical protein